MSVLDEFFFSGKNDISSEDKGKIIVSNLTSDVKPTLSSFGWNSQTLCGSVGLVLSADNESVERSVFLVSGPVDNKTILVEASKLWQEADSKIKLAITLKNGGVFSFSAGGLASDIVAQEDVEHGFVATEEGQQPAPVLAADFEEWGIGQFSLRMLCSLSKNTSRKTGVVIKHTLLIFPLSKGEMLDKYEAAQNPAWPGIKLTDGYMPLLPRPGTAWGCPVLPLIVVGTAQEEQEAWPPAAELRRAISATMGAAAKATIARTPSSLLNKWQKLASNPGDLAEERGDLVWPPAELPTDGGKYTSISNNMPRVIMGSVARIREYA